MFHTVIKLGEENLDHLPLLSQQRSINTFNNLTTCAHEQLVTEF